MSGGSSLQRLPLMVSGSSVFVDAIRQPTTLTWNLDKVKTCKVKMSIICEGYKEVLRVPIFSYKYRHFWKRNLRVRVYHIKKDRQLIAKYREKRRNLVMFFMDLEKAYYRVPKEVLSKGFEVRKGSSGTCKDNSGYVCWSENKWKWVFIKSQH